MRRPAPKPLWIKILGGIFYVAVCISALGAGAFSSWIGSSPVALAGFKQAVFQTPPQDIFEHKPSINILILGCDEDRAPGGKKVLREQARSDMMLVARLDFETKRISGISIPRDMLCEIPGYRAQKINAYHALGGPDLAKRAAESILGVNIDRVAVLDYKAFQEMVDLVGGVELYVNKKMKYTDRRGGLYIDFKPGRQTLNGYDAMCFVRYRHGDDDFHRQDRQKEFLLAFKDSVMKDPQMSTAIAEKAREVLGGGMSPEEVAALALFARKISSDNIKMTMVPYLEGRGYDLLVDGSKLQKTLREYHFLDDQPSSLSYRK